MPFVSIIVPVYNARPYLDECIESVKNQTHKNWELLLVDDGSSDGSLELCEEYSTGDDRIRVIKGVHGGVGAARNLGLDYARGEFIAFLDSDDWLDITFLESALSAKVDVYISGSKRMPANSLICIDDPIEACCECIKEQEFIELLRCNYISSVWGIVYRRTLIGELRFDASVNMGEDLRFVFSVLRNRECKLKAVPYAYYHYRVRDGSLTDTIDVKKVYSMRKTYEVLFQECECRAFGSGAYVAYIRNRLLSDLVYLDKVNSCSISKEKEEIQLGLAEINWHRRNRFKHHNCPVGNPRYLLNCLCLDIRRYQLERELTKIKNAILRRLPWRDT